MPAAMTYYEKKSKTKQRIETIYVDLVSDKVLTKTPWQRVLMRKN